MDSSFVQNPWDASYHTPYGTSFRGIPVQFMQPHSLKHRTVSIPVRFVGSERGRSESAIKIQKVFRGFLVRKNVKKIMAIREQVNDMERSVSKTEIVDLIRNDSKERLKVNEILMNLLFKLDSVRGVDSCVRDLRKSVTKRAIALQETVDAIVSGDHSVHSSSNAEVIEQGQDIVDSSDDCNQTLESESFDETTKSNDAECVLNHSNEIQQEGTDQRNEEEPSQNASFVNQENAGEEDEAGHGDDDKHERVRRDMLERLMKENDKMLRLMEALTERNEMQTRMLSALSQRVERVEKAFMCENLKRKKRRSNGKSKRSMFD